MVLCSVSIFTVPWAQANQVSPLEAWEDVQQLEGVWVRPDGGYTLKLSDIGPGGSLKAAYFNPQPINVARAEWRRLKNGLGIFVELQDVNYPGSTYSLIYNTATDRLQGIYFQALQQQRYLIEFLRKK
jgi:hypothetical protein